ncbi:unnamed protein product [Arctogadus glacialis]
MDGSHQQALSEGLHVFLAAPSTVSGAPTVSDDNRLFCVGLRGLNNPDIVATDVDPRHRDTRRADCTPRGFNRAGLELGATVEMMEAVVWRCSSGGPWRSSGGARLEVRGGRLEVLVWRSVAVVWRCSSGGPWRSSGGARLEVHGGRLEVLVWRSVAVVWRCSLQVEGRPGAVQPNGCRTKKLGDVAEVQAVGPVEVLEETVPAVEDGWGIRRWRSEGGS